MKKLLLSCALACACGLAVAAATGEDAKATVEAQTNTLIAELRANQATYAGNPAAFNQFVNSRVAPNMAFDKMAEIALGRHLQSVKAAGTFEAFRDAFRELLIRVYSKSWTEYTNAQISVIGTPTVDQYQRAKVRAQVVNNGQTNQIEFALWYDGGVWKLYDATFSNVSLSSGYRTTFDGEIQASGVDALIAKMKTMQ